VGAMLSLLLVEDNERLRAALRAGLSATGRVRVIGDCASGEEALALCLAERPDAIIMDVQLAGVMNGIAAAVAIRREFPRQPVVFYSIQDDDEYFRTFLRSGILSHYAYVRKSNYLLPQMIIPLCEEAASGRGYIDPEIEARVQAVRLKDSRSPLAALESNEQEVARMLALGLTNEQIAARLGFRDKRTISRTNGLIYATWGLDESTTDEKVARTRAALIVLTGRYLVWDADGTPRAENEHGDWVPWTGP
jgi:DNA-binding NarL/FixJ family response regulator